MHLRYSFRNLHHVYDENKRRKPPSIFEVKFDVNKFIIIAILFLEDSQMVETNWKFAYAIIYIYIYIYIKCIRTIIRNTKKYIYIYIIYYYQLHHFWSETIVKEIMQYLPKVGSPFQSHCCPVLSNYFLSLPHRCSFLP